MAGMMCSLGHLSTIIVKALSKASCHNMPILPSTAGGMTFGTRKATEKVAAGDLEIIAVIALWVPKGLSSRAPVPAALGFSQSETMK